MIDNLRRKLFHLVNGIRSNIPICCVIYFCKGDVEEKALRTWLRRNPDKEEQDWWYKSTNVPYVQCDKCYEENYSQETKENGTIMKWLLPPQKEIKTYYVSNSRITEEERREWDRYIN